MTTWHARGRLITLPDDFVIEPAKRAPRRVVEHHRCPRCGSTLITDDSRVWCTFVGSQGGNVQERPCVYGLDRPVLLNDLTAPPPFVFRFVPVPKSETPMMTAEDARVLTTAARAKQEANPAHTLLMYSAWLDAIDKAARRGLSSVRGEDVEMPAGVRISKESHAAAIGRLVLQSFGVTILSEAPGASAYEVSW